MVTGSKYALSNKSDVVFSVTEELIPPITPAKAIGSPPDVINRLFSLSSSLLLSRVIIFSPEFAFLILKFFSFSLS